MCNSVFSEVLLLRGNAFSMNILKALNGRKIRISAQEEKGVSFPFHPIAIFSLKSDDTKETSMS